MDKLFFNLVQLSHCFSNAPHAECLLLFFFFGTEDLRAFSISSGAYLIDVCIKLGGGISR